MFNSSCPDDRRRAASAIAILAAGLACLASAHAATFTVVNTNDSGPGSLELNENNYADAMRLVLQFRQQPTEAAG